VVVQGRDYSLTGHESALAVERGLATAQWYSCPVDRKLLKSLMRRSDGPAIRDTLIWLGAMVAAALAAIHFWGSWAAVPFFLIYGVLYGSASDSRWHECSHGTAFKRQWLNEGVYWIACVMIVREPVIWRWSHARHHTDTLIVGRDPEIQIQRPPNLLALALDMFALKHIAETLRKLVLHAGGRLTDDERTFVPVSEQKKVAWAARLGLLLIAGLIGWCLVVRSWLPAMLLGLPSIYGAFMGPFFATTQHAGLAEDVLDHRLNSRTVYMNPLFRFLYWNMNYHVEHHIFPLVPYHALPKLHQAVRVHCPQPYRGCWEAYREIIPAILRQRRDAAWYVRRPLPASTGTPQVQVASAAEVS
jgi:fatty acid desaturase